MKTGTMYRRFKNNDEKGFTLIEVLVAIAVFTAGVLATIVMQSSSVQTNSMARRTTEAGTIAADLLERLNALPYNDPQYLTPGFHSVGPAVAPDLDLREGQFSIANGLNLIFDTGKYRMDYTIAQNILIPNTMLITIRVWYRRESGRTWDINSPETRKVILVSVKANTI